MSMYFEPRETVMDREQPLKGCSRVSIKTIRIGTVKVTTSTNHI